MRFPAHGKQSLTLRNCVCNLGPVRCSMNHTERSVRAQRVETQTHIRHVDGGRLLPKKMAHNAINTWIDLALLSPPEGSKAQSLNPTWDPPTNPRTTVQITQPLPTTMMRNPLHLRHMNADVLRAHHRWAMVQTLTPMLKFRARATRHPRSSAASLVCIQHL